MGVPNVEETAAYYTEFGLIPTVIDVASNVGHGMPEARTFATVDGGEQLTIVHSPQRRLVRLGIGVDDPDDLDRVSPRWPPSGCPPGATRSASGRRIPVPG